MKREFLEKINLEGGAKLPKEVIDQIMAENGKDTEIFTFNSQKNRSLKKLFSFCSCKRHKMGLILSRSQGGLYIDVNYPRRHSEWILKI